MSFSKKVSKGILTAALGFSLMGGGTYAYFSDTVEVNNTFAAGTLDLSVNPETIVNVTNLKPGDEISREFTLTNNGTLDIHKVLLNTSYEVNDALGDNTDDFANHIKVTILYNQNNATVQVMETTLSELSKITPDITAVDTFVGGEKVPNGLKPGDINKVIVLFEFIDNGEDQNQFQGDALQLKWQFVAEQTEGQLNEG
ncbi:TasA family protein [Ornithinibacillus bavariensis]|uniref:Cell division protein FtsN n=1 Tax=Ornithinibacillus bavariensis TaxID=545502 RepID=A0A919X7P0_9BACI|nr:TasA family protein [Ornithinibacillus bavariensis]GIO26549.1 cell division protein FtsN [Ornithinibacillus bavariensis]